LGFGGGDFALDLGLDWLDEEGTPEIKPSFDSCLEIVAAHADLL
jgi:hypothetical protein